MTRTVRIPARFRTVFEERLDRLVREVCQLPDDGFHNDPGNDPGELVITVRRVPVVGRIAA